MAGHGHSRSVERRAVKLWLFGRIAATRSPTSSSAHVLAYIFMTQHAERPGLWAGSGWEKGLLEWKSHSNNDASHTPDGQPAPMLHAFSHDAAHQPALHPAACLGPACMCPAYRCNTVRVHGSHAVALACADVVHKPAFLAGVDASHHTHAARQTPSRSCQIRSSGQVGSCSGRTSVMRIHLLFEFCMVQTAKPPPRRGASKVGWARSAQRTHKEDATSLKHILFRNPVGALTYSSEVRRTSPVPVAFAQHHLCNKQHRVSTIRPCHLAGGPLTAHSSRRSARKGQRGANKISLTVSMGFQSWLGGGNTHSVCFAGVATTPFDRLNLPRARAEGAEASYFADSAPLRIGNSLAEAVPPHRLPAFCCSTNLCRPFTCAELVRVPRWPSGRPRGSCWAAPRRRRRPRPPHRPPMRPWLPSTSR